MSNGYALLSRPLLTNAAYGFGFLREAPSDERRRSIDFHVKSDDYFGTIATILGLIADSLSRDKLEMRKNLEDLKDELVYLQERYKIQSKR